MNCLTRKISWIAIGSFVIALAMPISSAAEVVDRIVARVNGQIILQSDWQDAVEYEALVSVTDASAFSIEGKKAALDRLIDQDLLRQQVHASDAAQAPDDQVAQKIAEIRKLYSEAGTDAGWKKILDDHGFTDAELRQRVAQEIQLLGLVDARLRPSVTIDSASIETYYSKELLPQLHSQQPASDVPLAEVTPRIRELLTEKKVSELLTSWLQNLRADSDIRSDSTDADESR
jgi:hypothetical protein